MAHVDGNLKGHMHLNLSREPPLVRELQYQFIHLATIIEPHNARDHGFQSPPAHILAPFLSFYQGATTARAEEW